MISASFYGNDVNPTWNTFYFKNKFTYEKERKL